MKTREEYCAILGVDQNADEAAIKAAFRKLAKKHHPDANMGDANAESRFKEINEAYSELTNPRPQYQQQHGGWGSGGGGPFQDINRRFHEEWMRHQQEAQRRAENPHIQTGVEISLEEAFSGCTVTVDLSSVEGAKDYSVSIPPGIQNGQRVRTPGAGVQRNTSHPPGDLFVEVYVRDHDRFNRSGSVLITDVRIDALEAILGTVVDITMIDGEKLRVTIPAGTQFGTRLRLEGKGMPEIGTTIRNDLYVNVVVVVPERLDERHIKLVDELTKLLPIETPAT